MPSDTPVSGVDVVHALSAVRLGDAGSEGDGAWTRLGYDLDGWISTPAQSHHCQPQPGGTDAVLRTDGEDGTDNAFGQVVVPLLREAGMLGSLSDTVTSAVLSGRSGMVFRMRQLGDATQATGLTVVLAPARGEDAGGSPVPPPAGSWAGHAWHPVAGAATTVQDAYVTAGVMVARVPGTFPVSLPVGEQAWVMPLRRAVLSLDLSDPATGHGQLAGIVPVESLVSSVRLPLASLSTSFCGESAPFAALASRLRAAADILTDGTQDPLAVCDGVSVGIGFETRPATTGDEVSAVTPPDPCAP